MAPDFVPSRILHGNISNPEKNYGLAERLQALTRTGTVREMLLAGTTLHELLIKLLDTPQASSELQPVAGKKFSLASRIRQALDAIAVESRRKVKLSEALAPFNCSYEHLCRVFKQAYGVGPLHYLHARQMTRAKALLKNSELTVAEICFCIGMNSPAHFAKTFRALIGKSPSEYRNGVK